RGVLDGGLVLAPGVAVVVRERSPEVDQRLEVDEIGVALVVRHDVGVPAAGAGVGPEAGRAVDVELEAAVGRAVDEGILRRRAPGAGLPIVAALVEPVQRLALGQLGVDNGGRTEPELAGDALDRRRADLVADGRDRSRGDYWAVRDGVGTRVVIGLTDQAALERADLQVVGAGLHVVDRVVDGLRAGQRVAVLQQLAGRAVEIQRDVIGGDVLGGDGIDGRISLDDLHVLHRTAARGRDSARE